MATGRRRTRQADTRRGKTPRGEQTTRFGPEASKEELVSIINTNAPPEVERNGSLEASVTAKNEATVIVPGDPDRCRGGNDANGYTVQVGYRKGSQIMSSEQVCLNGLGNSQTVTVDWNAPASTGSVTYEAFVRTLPTNSNRELATSEATVEVVDPSGGGGGGGDNGDDGNNNNNNDDPDPDPDPDPDNAGLLAFWRGLEQREKLAVGAGVGAIVLLSQNRRR
jgi:hypothetical protein